MPLTPEEQQELAQLHQKYGTPPEQPSKGLTPEEQQEFDQLHQKYGQSAQSSPIDNLKKLLSYNPSHEEEMKAVQHPITGMDDPAYQLAGLVSPNNAIVGAGKALKSGGDILMQKAIGLGRRIPGFGEALANEGLIGTKGMMAGQAEKGLTSAGKQIGDLASKIPGSVSQDQVANKVAELANSKMTSTGFIRPEDQAAVDKILSRAQDFAKSEPLTGAELAERRAVAGRSAREAGAYKTNPSSQLKSKIASAEQTGYSQALKDAYGKAFPGQTNALADADKSYSTLSTAKDILNKPENISGIWNGLSQYIPSSLMESIGGRAAIGAGKTVQKTPIGTVPLTLQQLLTPKDQE